MLALNTNQSIIRFHVSHKKINQQGNDLTATGKLWKVKFGNKKRVLGVTLYHNMRLSVSKRLLLTFPHKKNLFSVAFSEMVIETVWLFTILVVRMFKIVHSVE